jgi:hypothetical protein
VELPAKQFEDEHEDDKSFINSILVAPAGRIKLSRVSSPIRLAAFQASGYAEP